MVCQKYRLCGLFLFVPQDRGGKVARDVEEIKVRMTNYWKQRVEQFSALRYKELQGEKHRQWLEEFQTLLPAPTGLDILDIGTGTGFFAFLLGAQGHQVTGIDLTEDMVMEARRVAQQLGIAAEFHVMDAEAPRFPPHCFDVIVTRNLTWTLPHLPKAYQAWHTLLKRGGVLVNFDGDYCRETPHMLPENHAHRALGDVLMAEYQQMKQTLRPMQQPRPQWDVELLHQAGFCEVAVDTGVWKRIYNQVDEFYNPTPMFLVRATKPENGAAG